VDNHPIHGYLRDFEAAGEQPTALGSGLSGLCAQVVGVDGASVTLMVDGEHRGSLGASDDAMALVEDLQFTLGEGPCYDACRTGRAVLEPELGRADGSAWPAFAPPALHAGVAAVFAFPLQAAGVCLGAVDLYNRKEGDLEEGQLDEARAIAEVVSQLVLAVQSDAAPGSLAVAFEAAIDARAVVHQAAGMLSVQLVLPVAEALVRLRARAYALERLVNDVARDVIGRALRFDGQDTDPPT
jgi:GAF domain